MGDDRNPISPQDREKRRKLFPIRLTDFETLCDWTCCDADTGKDLAVEVREYFRLGFSNWKVRDAFESAFARLKKDMEEKNSRKCSHISIPARSDRLKISANRFIPKI
jgi:hypothetical protein